MDVSTVLVFYGTDEFAIQQKIQKLISDMGEPTTAEMNISRLDGRALNLNDLTNAANAIPFLSDRRLAILDHPYAAFKGAKDLKNLSALIASLPPTTTLVLAEVLDAPANKNKSFTGWLEKLTNSSIGSVKLQSSESNNPTRAQLSGWIVQETTKQAKSFNRNIGIEQAAAQQLAQIVSENSRIAAQEIAKLLEYVNFERNINLQDVVRVSIDTAQPDVFALVDAMGHKQGKQAQHVLQQLLQSGDPFAVWGMVIRQFRLLLLTRDLMDGGAGQDVIVRELHIHPFVAGKLPGQASRFDLAGLNLIYHRLLELDEGIKTGQMSIELAMEMLVVELAV
jgi:DNA polymerase-3 subunit delta